MTGPGATARPETRWLAQQLHDTVLQTLAIARIRLDQALAGTGPLPRSLAEDLRESLDQEIATLRALVRGAGRPAPAHPDLPSALAATADHLESATGIHFSVEDRSARHSWTRDDLAAWGILREALHNVAKHSGAEHAWITLTDRTGRLVGEVRDDGHGFDPATRPAGFGMTGMYAQAREAGAELAIDSRPSGTRVTLTLPRRDRPEALATPPGHDGPPAPDATTARSYGSAAPGGTAPADPDLEGSTSDDTARSRATADDRHLRRPSGRTVRDPHPPRRRPLPDRR